MAYPRVLLVSISLLFISLGIRIIAPGDYYAGWEILGLADGVFRVNTYSLWQNLSDQYAISRNYQFWTGVQSFLYTIIPAYLYQIYNSEFWWRVISLGLGLGAFAVTFRAFALNKIETAWTLLLLTGSSALLTGFVSNPFISVLLPHALALYIIFSKTARENPWITITLGVLVSEVAFQSYEISRTYFLVFLLAGITFKNETWKSRVLWLAIGLIPVLQIVIDYLTKGYGGQPFQFGDALIAGANDLPHVASLLLKALFIEMRLDIPILAVVGYLSLINLNQKKLFWWGLYLAQIIMLLALASHGEGSLRPRRVLLFEFYNIVFFIALIKENTSILFGEHKRDWLLKGVIVLGAFLQVGHTLYFYTQNFPESRRSHPYVNSVADFKIPIESIDWVNKIKEFSKNFDKVFLLYNFDAYPENTTDPAAVLERLYLRMGHAEFENKILIHHDRQRRYSRVPMHPHSNLINSISTAINNNQRIAVLAFLDPVSTKFRIAIEKDRNKILKTFKMESCEGIDRDWMCWMTPNPGSP